MIIFRIKCVDCPREPSEKRQPITSNIETLAILSGLEDFAEEEIDAIQKSLAVNFCPHVAEALRKEFPKKEATS